MSSSSAPASPGWRRRRALAEAGQRVLVLEARGQLGGRATAFIDRETGERVDNGQHVLFGCYRETFAFLRRIGAERQRARAAVAAVPYLDRDGRRTVLRCPTLPSPLHLLAGGVPMGALLGWRDRVPGDSRWAAPLLRARRRAASRRARARQLPTG